MNDNNVHLYPQFRIEMGTAHHTGWVIAWNDAGGDMQQRHMLSYFLAHRWAAQIAAHRGMGVVEHIAVKQ